LSWISPLVIWEFGRQLYNWKVATGQVAAYYLFLLSANLAVFAGMIGTKGRYPDVQPYPLDPPDGPRTSVSADIKRASVAKITHIDPTSRRLPKAFADRLCDLIKRSDDPRAEMICIESYLDEAGLWFGGLAVYHPISRRIRSCSTSSNRTPVCRRHCPRSQTCLRRLGSRRSASCLATILLTNDTGANRSSATLSLPCERHSPGPAKALAAMIRSVAAGVELSFRERNPIPGYT
jgi:hypothetical protein